MTLLILGLVLWTVAHMFKRIAPGARQAMEDRMGSAAKGVIAAVLVLSVVLMVIGYRGIETDFYWGRSAATTGINNLLMLAAVALFGLGSSKSRLRAWFRHPMLWGVVVWALAHILVNGDTASLILFGWLAIWALVEMQLVNRAVHSYVPYEGGSIVGDARLAIITVLVYAVISVIHIWLGYNPFGG